MINRKDFIESMDDTTINAGLIKFNIPEYDKRYETNGEGVWGYADEENIKKYYDSEYDGCMTAILLNNPWTYSDKIHLFDELPLICHNELRPTLDPAFIEKLYA